MQDQCDAQESTVDLILMPACMEQTLIFKDESPSALENCKEQSPLPIEVQIG